MRDSSRFRDQRVEDELSLELEGDEDCGLMKVRFLGMRTVV